MGDAGGCNRAWGRLRPPRNRPAAVRPDRGALPVRESAGSRVGLTRAGGFRGGRSRPQAPFHPPASPRRRVRRYHRPLCLAQRPPWVAQRAEQGHRDGGREDGEREDDRRAE
jgi:hypothetical protein